MYCLPRDVFRVVRTLKMNYFKSKHVAQLDRPTPSSNKDTVVLRLIFIYLFISLTQRDVTRKNSLHFNKCY